jgi:hypothetical protein
MTKLNLNIHGVELEYKGNEKFLETKVLPFLESFSKSHNEEAKRNLLVLNEDLQQNLTSLDDYSSSISRSYEELDTKIKQFSEKSARFLEAITTQGNSQEQLSQAAKEMQEMQMSFNLQYLGLQSHMQNENRQFTMLSNIMKTKHDTVKNTISNIR